MRHGRPGPVFRAVVPSGRVATGRGGAARSAVVYLVALLASWMCAGVAAHAQNIGVRARVDRENIEEGGQTSLVVEVFGPTLGEVGPPDVSGITEFDIVGGPMTSNRFQWINGRTSATRSYTYLLRPRRTGSLRIPALGLLVNGRTFRTEAVNVEVYPAGSAGAPGPRPSPPGANPGAGGGPGRPARPGSSQSEGDGTAMVRVVADVDTRTAYVGQQVTLRVLLDTQTEILNLGMKDTPTFPGFWAEEIKLPENLELRRIVHGADTYSEYTLMKRALFPTGSGTLTIPPLSYQIQVRRRSQDPIESFFFTPTETITRRTEPIAIRIQPLPSGSRPEGFSGAVGNFTLAVTADRKDSRVNDAIGVKVRVTGEGNLNAVNALPLPDLSDFKQYAPKISSSTNVVADRLRGEKVWDYVLIPLAPGQQTIPPVRFSFFDAKAGTFRTVASPPLTIQVARGADGDAGTGAGLVAQRDVRQLRRDIRFIKQAPDGLRDRSLPMYRAPWFIALVLLPLAADLGLFTYTRTRDSQRAHARQRRERRARSLARRRLKEARRRMSPSTTRAFYAEVAQALTEYVAAKFDTSASGLTRDRIEDLLATRGAAEEDRRAFHRCLEACDYARFAPTSSGSEEMRRTLLAAEEILVRLERSLAA
ncbi:MAG TPA: BatD family protein [Candidatus Polarisedimenticolia bacterium]|nr:BatD family protein [Candidatus Polarisedimenticolia bacterium]